MFFGLVLALSGTFYLVGFLAGDLPWIGARLPASALMFVCPAVAAVMLVRRRGGRRGLRAWLSAAFRPPRRRQVVWYLVAALLPPLIMVLSYLVMRGAGMPLPESPVIRWSHAPLLAVIFLVSALAEELGWSGYATGPLRRRWGTLAAGLVIGVVWAAWHVVPHLQTGHDLAWIAGHGTFTVLFRVILVSLYAETGASVVAPTICHASFNVAWSLFPNAGSHYHPTVTAAVTAAAAAVVLALPPRRRRRRAYGHRDVGATAGAAGTTPHTLGPLPG